LNLKDARVPKTERSPRGGPSEILSAVLISRRRAQQCSSASCAKDDFNKTVTQLQETIQSLSVSAREVTSASAEISTSTTDLSQRTGEQAANLQETSASME
jgi:methyl-accepting chemotaxis protein